LSPKLNFIAIGIRFVNSPVTRNFLYVIIEVENEPMNPRFLIEAETFLIDASADSGAAQALAKEASLLLRSATQKLWTDTRHSEPEMIRTIADIVRDRAGDVVTPVPRRIISGSLDGTINAQTVSIDVLSPARLLERIKSEKVNRDLLDNKPINGSDLRRLHYLRADTINEQTHITLSVGSRIVGVAGVRTDPYEASHLWVEHLSVEEKYQGRGFARNIAESIYDYALRRDQKVVPSAFSEDGQRLKAIFNRLDKRYPQAASGLPHRDF
jgi:GNAT superfamily N-acetyltransferase